jgi:hypothetical protein
MGFFTMTPKTLNDNHQKTPLSVEASDFQELEATFTPAKVDLLQRYNDKKIERVIKGILDACDSGKRSYRVEEWDMNLTSIIVAAIEHAFDNVRIQKFRCDLLVPYIFVEW